jgi:rhodanese-related sulfurtransferase
MQNITSLELKGKIRNKNHFIYLDVRQEYEYNIAHIKDSILIPLDQLEVRIDELDSFKNSDIVVYCKAGVRSMIACHILESNGFECILNLADGMCGWLE